MNRVIFCVTGNAATNTGVLSQNNETRAGYHLMCNIAEHLQLVCYLLVFLLIFL